MSSAYRSSTVPRSAFTLCLVAALALSLSACGETRACRAATGAALGAAGGALIGAVAGNPGAGAVVGGVTGAAVGGLTSSHQISAGHKAPCH
jgi:hypothetical protein